MIVFKKLTEDDMPLFMSWVKKPYVQDTWFVDGYESIDKYSQNIDGNGYDYAFIIYLDNKAIGYMQCSDLYAYRTKCTNPKGLFTNEQPGTFCLDLFIGEEQYLNKGYGTQIVMEFVVKLLQDFKATKILIDPACSNKRAIRCYEKAGFKIIRKEHDGVTECCVMEWCLDTKQSHEHMISIVIKSHFEQCPKFIRRIAIGICNEVYDVGLNEREVIVRLSSENRFLMGSHDHIPKFKALGITVPDILAEDYTKTDIPFSYQIQSKIEGEDLGEVIGTLTDTQLKKLAQEIASIFKKVKTIPASSQFGVIWGGGENELSDTWTQRMRIWIDESRERGEKTGVMDNEMSGLAENLYSEYKSYFDSVKPVTYYGDICSKNVMIKDGKFSGLVDLDGLTQGDPLEAIGRIKLSWYGTYHGEIYTNAVMDELALNQMERKIVIVYALLNKISWTCENGIQFNQNTAPIVDKGKEMIDKALIKVILKEL